jgi:hypothetical protein
MNFGRRQTITKLPPAPPPLPAEEQIPTPSFNPLESFRAALMQVFLDFRQKREGAGAFELFKAAVAQEVERYRKKPFDQVIQKEIEAIADRAINRVRLNGLTAFEPGN